MSQYKDLLQKLAQMYGGTYEERPVVRRVPTAETGYLAILTTAKAIFKDEHWRDSPDEPDQHLQERVRRELLMGILSSGVQYIHEKSELHELFNQ